MRKRHSVISITSLSVNDIQTRIREIAVGGTMRIAFHVHVPIPVCVCMIYHGSFVFLSLPLGLLVVIGRDT